MVFVPVGGGGLIAGIAAYYKAVMPEVKIIGVEPEDAACLKAALEADEPVTLEQVGLFADGVAVKRIGQEPFRLAREYVDEVVTVSSDEICAAVKDIFEDTRAIAEPAGALSLAGLKKYVGDKGKGEKLAAILSGANVNFHSLRYVSERCELGEHKEAVLAVTIPERPGSFLHFCELLERRVMTEFNYRFSGRDRAVVFAGIRLSEGVSELQAIVSRPGECRFYGAGSFLPMRRPNCMCVIWWAACHPSLWRKNCSALNSRSIRGPCCSFSRR